MEINNYIPQHVHNFSFIHVIKNMVWPSEQFESDVNIVNEKFDLDNITEDIKLIKMKF